MVVRQDGPLSAHDRPGTVVDIVCLENGPEQFLHVMDPDTFLAQDAPVVIPHDKLIRGIHGVIVPLPFHPGGGYPQL